MSDPAPNEHELISRYFDGELEAADEQRALDHLAQCAKCQAELGDLVGFDFALRAAATADGAPAQVAAVVSTAERAVSPRSLHPGAAPLAEVVPLTAARRHRRGTWIAAGAAIAAAAAALLWWRGAGGRPNAPRLALGPTRAVEVRLSAEPFAEHRPYSVVRGGGASESFSLDTLAAIERRNDRALLAAAQLSGGERARARDLLVAMPPSASRESDLAAVELAAGKPEAALEAADRALGVAPALAAARWNRALALRELGLVASAALELDAVAARREPGWASEAAEKAAALRAALGDRGPASEAFAKASRAMIDRSGPPLPEALVAARPGLARIAFHDALRSAAGADEARALRPMAEALDRAVGNQLAVSAVERVAAARFAVRGPLARAYRELALSPSVEAGLPLLAELDRVRDTSLDDLRLGAILLAGQTQARRAELERLIAATADPWFMLYWPLEEATAQEAAGAGDLAESGLRTALANCDARLWAHRCAHLAWRLSTLYMNQGRYIEAEQHVERAASAFRASGALELEDVALSRLAEVQRGLGRYALAAATFREVRARLGGRDCSASRYAAAGEAMIEIYRRAELSALSDADVEACGEPPSRFEVAMMVDLARMTDRPADRARALRWIEAARRSNDPGLTQGAALASARLDLETDPTAAERLRAGLGGLRDEGEETRAFRAWVMQSLVDHAARGGRWKDVIALLSEELGAPAPQACVLGVSLDDTRVTVAALGAAGAATGAWRRAPSPQAVYERALIEPTLVEALAGCAHIAVIARPPLHGRTDLLPPTSAWSFVGQRRRAPAPWAPTNRELYVGDAVPPAALALPALAPLRAPARGQVLRGAEATPARVLEALAGVDYAELHVHGQVDLSVADASFLALSPGSEKRWALTAAEVRKARLSGAPIVVLAACHAATTAPYEHRRWSLPDAFLEAGARAVIAPTVEIPDDQAAAFFAELRGKLAAGAVPAVALAELRSAFLARGAAWAAKVALFE